MTHSKLFRFFQYTCLGLTCLAATATAQVDVEGPTLREQLEATNRGFTERMDPAIVQTIDTAVTDVQDMGVAGTAKRAGDLAPDFTLPDASGKDVTLSGLLKNGPVVLTWYRGNW